VAKGASKDAKDQTAIGAITDLKEARARLAKAAGITAGGADYRALLSAFSSSLEPSDALLLLSESIPALPQAERYPFLVESGDLSLLLGLFADAASRYAEASSLAKGGKDERLLLRSARCSLAAGDPERASAVSADVLIGSPEPFLADEARLVSAWALVAQGRTADARAVAASVAAPATGGSSHDDARLADRDDRCEARFILWLIAGDSAGKAAIASSLASDFPGSPEALIATGAATAPPLPHWYLGGLGADISSGAASSREASGDSKPAKRVGEGESPAGQSAALIEKTAVAAGKAAPGKRLQLGYFSVGENAEALKDELASKGFAAAVEERLRPDKSGGEVKRWIVTVESGADLAKTIQKLKDAGYEAYTIE
jgi:cell division septation protein DedD